MRPDFRLAADGVDVTANIRDRLLALSFKDEAEAKSDRLTIRLDDRPRRDGYAALPAIGTTLELSLGYRETGLVAVGRFTVDEIKQSGPVAVLEVGAKAAGMDTAFRSATSRSWPDTTLGAIARAIAEAAGFEPVIDPALGAVPIPHADQTNESPMAFLNRLAGQHDGIAKPVAGRLVLAPRGTAKTATGKALPAVTVAPGQLTEWNYAHSARREAGQAEGKGTAAGGVQTVYWDRDEAMLKKVTAGEPPYQNVRFATSGAGEAKTTATAAKNQAGRAKAKFTASGPGNPVWQAEQRLTLAGFRPGIPTDWRVVSVEHRLEDGGYACSLTAELFDDGQADVAAAAAQDVVRF